VVDLQYWFQVGDEYINFNAVDALIDTVAEDLRTGLRLWSNLTLCFKRSWLPRPREVSCVTVNQRGQPMLHGAQWARGMFFDEKLKDALWTTCG